MRAKEKGKRGPKIKKKRRVRRKNNKEKSQASKGRKRAANYEAKGGQEMMKTGQRKRNKMAVIKIKKQDSEHKGEENGQNKVEEG